MAKQTFRFSFVAMAMVVLLLLSSLPMPSRALSAKSAVSNSNSKINSNSNSNSGVRIRLFDPSVESESSLQLLRDCRRLSFPAEKQNWLNSERDFVQAKSVVEGKNLCVVAIDDQTSKVVGSADLARTTMTGKSNVVLNVFVQPDQRGRGIGRLLMAEGVHTILAKEVLMENINKNNNKNTNREAQTQEPTVVISLDVYTNNKPAITLYQNLGYEPSSPVHSGTLAMANVLGANLVVTMSKTIAVPIE